MMVGIGKRPAANYKFDPLPLALAQAGSYCTDIWNEKKDRFKRFQSHRAKLKVINIDTALHNVHFGYYVYLPTEQAETNIC